MIINVTSSSSSYTNISWFKVTKHSKKKAKTHQKPPVFLKSTPIDLPQSFSSQWHFGHSPRHSPAASPPTSLRALQARWVDSDDLCLGRVRCACGACNSGAWDNPCWWENHGIFFSWEKSGDFFENNMGYAGIEDWQCHLSRKWGATNYGPKGWQSWENDDKPWEL